MGVNVAIVGATGLVGRTFIKVLEERNFPVDNLYLFASKRTAGQKLTFKGNEYTVEELTEKSFDRDIKIALFSAGATVSKMYAPIAAEKGVTVVDNSSAWRMDDNVPLVVPEVNPQDIKWNKGIIANPNCSTIQMVVPLKPLHDRYKIRRIVVSTYQAVSGAGKKGVDDLERTLNGEKNQCFPYPIANNCIPHIDVFLPDGYTKEELKMINETKKIMGDNSIKVSPTTVRVPVKNSHSESINIEFEKPYQMEDLKNILKNAPGVVLMDDPENNIYPVATIATGHDEVFVGRLRRDETVYSGLNMWIVADNIRKGAASNAVQIAELLIK
ncbi:MULTISPECIES: aspartate-semialdehyde dehydrogenase [Thermoanaerobacterium]|uniref:Aspartate-semialdehyde dehydrogenase n=1 Tax=Thermoanaerobacterium xylanolyticum (strain ATCC 49914 / DSM 7097 / LX-11) TaxID=858215 RepID=F6BI11_THEXL|nr:aspartate-semialdehyde dehydrogenase [Thermoanaerobacterium xylanolyticum]AEF17685.1 aspartate-semialdehyde dehydrogenase [Thermoanaerobacterium xylanolyticum LX-11]